MDEWITDTVINLQSRGILRVEDGNHGESRPRPDEFVDAGVAFIRAADMANGMVLFDRASKINEVARKRITKGIGKPGDILISHKGTIGKIARAPIDAQEFVCSPQTTFWRSTDEDILSQDFLFAYMRSPKFIQEFSIRSGETDMADYVSLTSQRCLSLTIPPIKLQHKISSLLSAIDDKIELNRRMNETLEAMARVIFKDWFVDFGPTRAKMEGRAPYLAPDIWSLFPDRLDDEGKPEGWQQINLREAADVSSGGTPNKNNPIYWNGSIPWVSPKIMTDLHVFDSDQRVTPAAIGNGTRLSPAGSVLLMVRGMGLHQGVRVSQARVDVTFNQDVKALVPRGISAAHLLFGMLDAVPYLFSKVEASGHGTGTLPTDVIEKVQFVSPRDAAYDELVAPLDLLNDKIVLNNQESVTLAATRDLLLPKLMSGEIRVKDAEEIASEVL